MWSHLTIRYRALLTLERLSGVLQWFFFSRNIGYLTPKIMQFHHLQTVFPGSKYFENITGNVSTRVLV